MQSLTAPWYMLNFQVEIPATIPLLLYKAEHCIMLPGRALIRIIFLLLNLL